MKLHHCKISYISSRWMLDVSVNCLMRFQSQWQFFGRLSSWRRRLKNGKKPFIGGFYKVVEMNRKYGMVRMEKLWEIFSPWQIKIRRWLENCLKNDYWNKKNSVNILFTSFNIPHIMMFSITHENFELSSP